MISKLIIFQEKGKINPKRGWERPILKKILGLVPGPGKLKSNNKAATILWSILDLSMSKKFIQKLSEV